MGGGVVWCLWAWIDLALLFYIRKKITKYCLPRHLGNGLFWGFLGVFFIASFYIESVLVDDIMLQLIMAIVMSILFLLLGWRIILDDESRELLSSKVLIFVRKFKHVKA